MESSIWSFRLPAGRTQRWRSLRMSRSIRSDRRLGGANCVMSEIASLITGLSGTTVLYLRSFSFSSFLCQIFTRHAQTWEDPYETHPDTRAKGDNGLLDVCEIGEQIGFVGQVKQVKVLGIMAVIDNAETDWKVIVIDVQDPMASKINGIEDVERGLIRATNEWFRLAFYMCFPPNI